MMGSRAGVLSRLRRFIIGVHFAFLLRFDCGVYLSKYFAFYFAGDDCGGWDVIERIDDEGNFAFG